jgi:hypothetical protein
MEGAKTKLTRAAKGSKVTVNRQTDTITVPLARARQWGYQQLNMMEQSLGLGMQMLKDVTNLLGVQQQYMRDMMEALAVIVEDDEEGNGVDGPT